jgi:hypothetical protein
VRQAIDFMYYSDVAAIARGRRRYGHSSVRGIVAPGERCETRGEPRQATSHFASLTRMSVAVARSNERIPDEVASSINSSSTQLNESATRFARRAVRKRPVFTA